MNKKDDLAARHAAFMADQERLLEVIRIKQTELVQVGRNISASLST